MTQGRRKTVNKEGCNGYIKRDIRENKKSGEKKRKKRKNGERRGRRKMGKIKQKI